MTQHIELLTNERSLPPTRQAANPCLISLSRVYAIVEQLTILGLDRDALVARAREAFAVLLGYRVEFCISVATVGNECAPHTNSSARSGGLGRVIRIPLPNSDGPAEQFLLAEFDCAEYIEREVEQCQEFLCRLLAQAIANAQVHAMLLDAAEKYRAIFDGSPEGIVVLDLESPEGPWPIRECNRSFCEMNGYASPDELRGKDILVVSVGNALGQDTRAEYLQRVRERGVLRGGDVHRRRDGTDFPVEFSTRVLQLGGKECVLGIDRDVSEDVRLRRVIDDLRHDIGRTFHTLTGTLLQVESALTPTIAALVPNAAEKQATPPIEQIWPELVTEVSSAAGVLRRLIEESHASLGGREALAVDDWTTIERHLGALSGTPEGTKTREMMVPVVQLRARELSNALRRLRSGHISRALVREALRRVERLELLCCCIGLRFARDRVMDTDFLVRDIRERVETGRIHSSERATCSLLDMVNDAVGGLAQLAAYHRLDINLKRSQDLTVHVVRHDLVRCINNLIHNAIKYSWTRLPGRNGWIDLSVGLDGRHALVTIEDYGVPVHADELEGDRVFEFGYRGRLASDRGRIGTGVGLFDSRDVARRFGGEVTLESRPASKEALPDDMTRPHLKTATLRLPMAGAGARE